MLLKNSVLNLAGYFLPALVAIPALGILAHSLPIESFGLLSLMMAILGYAGILDCGLTRAVIRELAIYRGSIAEQKAIISTSTVCILLLAVVATLLLEICSPLLIGLFNASAQMESALLSALLWMWLAFPLFLLAQLWLSFLEGRENFLLLAKQKTVSGIAVSGFPALAVLYDNSLMAAVFGFLLARVLTCLLAFYCVRQEVIAAGLRFHRPTFNRFIKFGGWLTLSNIIGPLMTYLDRFFVSNALGAGVMATYAGPAEIINKLVMIPMAIARTFFPYLSRLSGSELYRKHVAIAYLFITLPCVLICIAGYLFAHDIMHLWLGGKYLGDAVIVLQILLAGFLSNAIAQVPFTQLHAKGFSKLTAIIHLVEVVPYLLLLYFAIKQYGVVGTAIAWSARSIIDLLLLLLAVAYSKSRLLQSDTVGNKL